MQMKYFRFLLFPFSIIYYIVTTIRNFFFDIGILKSTSFSFPVIVVGNLSVGGTGKTPQVEYLINLLKNKFNIAILSRGYKRKSKGFVLVNNHHTVRDVGDEPLQYFKKFSDVSIAVDVNRVEGIKKLGVKNSLDAIVLDDAYQHRKVKGSYYILLTKYDDLFLDDFILPVGNLREARVGASRADCIVITKCPEHITLIERENIQQRLSKYCKTVFFSTIVYSDKIYGNLEISLKELKKYKVLLITGIANPKPLLNFMDQQEVSYKHLQFSDHHNFTSKEITTIKDHFNKLENKQKIILTTEKDYVRISNKLKVSYLPIKTKFLENSTQFDELILNHISNK